MLPRRPRSRDRGSRHRERPARCLAKGDSHEHDTFVDSALDRGRRPAGPDQDRPRRDTTGRRPATGERALVLGGGGSTGNAWLIGVLAGLFEAALDVTAADLTIGTSAGSTAAVQTAGARPTELLIASLDAAPPHPGGPAGADRGRGPARSAAGHLE